MDTVTVIEVAVVAEQSAGELEPEPTKRDEHALKKWTYADYYSWDDKISEYIYKRCELIDGIEYDFITPTPPPIHQVILGALAVQFANHLVDDKKREVFMAPFDVRLPDIPGRTNDDEILTVVQPDILVCDYDTLDDRGVVGAPLLVVEIMSPVTAAYDMKEKYVLYERVGVLEYWVVNTHCKSLMVFRLNTDGLYDRPDIYGSIDQVKVPLLGDFTVYLKQVFSREF